MDKRCGGNCGEENWGRTDNSRLERIIYMIADMQTLVPPRDKMTRLAQKYLNETDTELSEQELDMTRAAAMPNMPRLSELKRRKMNY